MRELETIQTKEKLNNVFAADEKGPGGANHEYHITLNNGENSASDVVVIQMQKGPRNEKNSIHGVANEDLLEIVRDRLIGFQNGPFANMYNAAALESVENALQALNDRVEDRISRKVLGKNIK